MRWLEVRRHSLTKKGTARGRGSHLSLQGVALARAVGAQLGPFTYVVTSPAPRAIETAVAMGFAVDDTIELPSGYVPGQASHHQQWTWPCPYLTYAQLIQSGGDLAAAAEAHRDHWARTAQALPDGAAALVVSHGGTIEPALVACLPRANHSSWGAPFSHCDGARLGFENGRFVIVRFRRAPTPPSAPADHPPAAAPPPGHIQ